MNKNNTKSVSGGTILGFGGLLAIAFIILKLTGVIAWSWLWVLAPLWIPLAFGIVIIIIAVIIGLIYYF